MEILEWLQKLLTDYGMVNVIIMFLVIVLTNIIKKPIVNKAEDFVESAKKLTGIDVDKTVITKFLPLIPIGLAFVFYFIYGLIQINFQIAELDWSIVLSNAVAYGLLSISIFEVVKNLIKGYTSKKSYNEAKKKLTEVNTTEDDLLVSSDSDEVEPEAEIVEETTVEENLEKETEVKNV